MSESADFDTPEMKNYVVTTTRKFEVDFSEEQVKMMMQETGTETAEDAIQQALFQQEVQHIQPEQKLLGIDVNANEPSNNKDD
jgi:hypothetical protein